MRTMIIGLSLISFSTLFGCAVDATDQSSQGVASTSESVVGRSPLPDSSLVVDLGGTNYVDLGASEYNLYAVRTDGMVEVRSRATPSVVSGNLWGPFSSVDYVTEGGAWGLIALNTSTNQIWINAQNGSPSETINLSLPAYAAPFKIAGVSLSSSQIKIWVSYRTYPAYVSWGLSSVVYDRQTGSRTWSTTPCGLYGSYYTALGTHGTDLVTFLSYYQKYFARITPTSSSCNLTFESLFGGAYTEHAYYYQSVYDTVAPAAPGDIDYVPADQAYYALDTFANGSYRSQTIVRVPDMYVNF